MKPYKVKRSKIDNLGLYAAKNIKKGSKIIDIKEKLLQGEKQKKTQNMIMIKQFIFLI